ncbi:MAG: heavy-metal-associated domain-containing protein [Ferruginibacter sp.]
MKTRIIFLGLFLISLCATKVFAQRKTESINVSGNCGMCKNTIEKAAKSAGANKAQWDAGDQRLTVTYNENKTTMLKIQEAIAATGYDTEAVRATDEAYNRLHGCCQYERTMGNGSKKACCQEPTCGQPTNQCTSKGSCPSSTCCKS